MTWEETTQFHYGYVGFTIQRHPKEWAAGSVSKFGPTHQALLQDLSWPLFRLWDLFYFLFIFNWRIIALQYCSGFCHISTWTSHAYTISPASWTSLPPSSLSNPSRLSQSPGLMSLSHIANSHWLAILHIVVYVFPCYSLHCPTLSFHHPLLDFEISLF